MTTILPQPPRIFVISAPSGTGKTTLNRRLVVQHPQVAIAVSHTTRKRRPNEKDGVDYHFVDHAAFKVLIESQQMLEYAKVFDNYYGTSKSEVERLAQLQKIVILEIDVQGWQQTKKIFPFAQSVFIVPPSILTVWKRLEFRGTDDLAARFKRLNTAYSEISSSSHYDHFIINDDIETAYRQLESLVIEGKNLGLSQEQGLAHCQQLLREFDQAAWLEDVRKELMASQPTAANS